MNKIFVDTAGWANLADISEPFHTEAKEIYDSAISTNKRLVTTNYVLAETVAVLTSPMRISRPRVIEFVTGIKASSFFDVIHVDERIDAQSWNLLVNRPDKDWSLVDSSCFVLMEQLQITDALTSDRHFEQAGFVRLLK